MQHDQQAPKPPRLAGFSYLGDLGAGGFARVYKYAQELPQRKVAVKVPLRQDPQTYDAFQREVRTLSPIADHPAVVSLYQVELANDGRPCLVMQLCDRSLKPSKLEVQNLQPGTVLQAGIQVAGALETAHRAGILHRDIKPGNILLGERGQAMLTDFGIARTNFEPGATTAMTLPWAAPEIVTNDSTGSVKTEIWSLGATLWQLLAGYRIFDPLVPQLTAEKRAQKWRQNITAARYQPLPQPELAGIDGVLRRALSKDPEARFGSMLEFAMALQQQQAELRLPVTNCEVFTPHVPRTLTVTHPQPSAAGGVEQQESQHGMREPVRLSQSRAVRRAARGSSENYSSTSPRRRGRVKADIWGAAEPAGDGVSRVHLPQQHPHSQTPAAAQTARKHRWLQLGVGLFTVLCLGGAAAVFARLTGLG